MKMMMMMMLIWMLITTWKMAMNEIEIPSTSHIRDRFKASIFKAKATIFCPRGLSSRSRTVK